MYVISQVLQTHSPTPGNTNFNVAWIRERSDDDAITRDHIRMRINNVTCYNLT